MRRCPIALRAYVSRRRVEPGDRAQPSEAGQTSTEWLMVAGVLLAVALLLGKLVPDAIRVYSEALIYMIRTIAP